jgi:hypothetical protein
MLSRLLAMCTCTLVYFALGHVGLLLCCNTQGDYTKYEVIFERLLRLKVEGAEGGAGFLGLQAGGDIMKRGLYRSFRITLPKELLWNSMILENCGTSLRPV